MAQYVFSISPRKPSSILMINLFRPAQKVPYSDCGSTKLCTILGTCTIVGGRCKMYSSQALQSCIAYRFRRLYAGQCLYHLWREASVLALICSVRAVNGGPASVMPGPAWNDWPVIHWSYSRRKRKMGQTTRLKKAPQLTTSRAIPLTRL